MAETHHSKVLIIGSGPAGYTAAVYTARASLAPTLITGMEVGGQMSITTDVENYPGFADVIQGPWLMEQMHAQAEHVGTRMINDLIVDVNFTQRPFVCREILATPIRRIRSSFRPERRRVGWDWKRNRSFRALAYLPARPVTVFSIAKNKSRWSAAVMPRLRRRYT